MTFKILLFILLLIIAEIVHLIKQGIIEHKFAFGILKIMVLNTIFLLILYVKTFFYVLLKIKKVMPEKIKSAAKAIMTPIKTLKKEI